MLEFNDIRSKRAENRLRVLTYLCQLGAVKRTIVVGVKLGEHEADQVLSLGSSPFFCHESGMVVQKQVVLESNTGNEVINLSLKKV